MGLEKLLKNENLTNAIMGRFHAEAIIASLWQNSSGPMKAETPWSRFSVIIFKASNWSFMCDGDNASKVN